MYKKFILPIAILTLLSLAVFVLAQESRVAIPLSKGWNLVSGFTSIENIYGADIQGSNIKAIYAYIAPAQQYIRMYPKPEVDKLRSLTSTYNFDDDIIAASALWVYSDKDGTLGYNFDISPPPFENIPIYKGWNFAPITPEMIGKHLQDIKGNCDITKVAVWLPESQA